MRIKPFVCLPKYFHSIILSIAFNHLQLSYWSQGYWFISCFQAFDMILPVYLLLSEIEEITLWRLKNQIKQISWECSYKSSSLSNFPKWRYQEICMQEGVHTVFQERHKNWEKVSLFLDILGNARFWCILISYAYFE